MRQTANPGAPIVTLRPGELLSRALTGRPFEFEPVHPKNVWVDPKKELTRRKRIGAVHSGYNFAAERRKAKKSWP